MHAVSEAGPRYIHVGPIVYHSDVPRWSIICLRPSYPPTPVIVSRRTDIRSTRVCQRSKGSRDFHSPTVRNSTARCSRSASASFRVNL